MHNEIVTMANMRRKSPSSSSSTPKKMSGSSANNKRARPTIDLGWKGGDDEIDSDDGDGRMRDDRKASMDSDDDDEDDDDDEEEEGETLEAKKVRLAREYLQKIERAPDESSSDENNDDGSEDDDDEEPTDRVGLKLQKQRLKRAGTYEREIADKIAKRISAIKLDITNKRILQQKAKTESVRKPKVMTSHQLAGEWVDNDHTTLLKGHDLTTTCVSLQADGSRAVSGSKDHSVILWDIESSRKLVDLWEHWKKRGDTESRTEGQVLSVACSDDGRYAAVGRRDATVSIFDIRQPKNNLVKTFTGHKSGITSLAFQTQSLQLFSGSEDRCIRYVVMNHVFVSYTLS